MLVAKLQVKDSEEDRRRRFLKEKRMREEAQRQEDFDRAQDEEEERKSAELARLDSRRMAIRLRIQEQVWMYPAACTLRLPSGQPLWKALARNRGLETRLKCGLMPSGRTCDLLS